MSGGNKTFTFDIVLSGNPRIDGILDDAKWGNLSGYITYSDTVSSQDYQDSHSENFTNFSQLSSQQLSAAHFALNGTSTGGQPAPAGGFSVHGFTAMNIWHLDSADGQTTIRLANTDDPLTVSVYSPGDNVEDGDIFFGGSGRVPSAGNSDWHTVLNAVGQSLGLKVGQNSLPVATDSMEYSVMTVRSYVGDPLIGGYSNGVIDYAQTFMMDDIAALQYLYGANYFVNSDDTVYTWTPGSGDTVINGLTAIDASGNRIFATLWDGGGKDTYDLSAYTTDLEIDLRAGNYSKFDSTQLANLGDGNISRGNIFNAHLYQGNTASLIENAIGGSGNDLLQGNEGINVLTGGLGDDRLFGYEGDDIFDGGIGADEIVGGSGDDTVTYNSSAAGVSINLADNTASGGEANGDILSGIESIVGTDHNDVLIGNSLDNNIDGGDGEDEIDGKGGADTLIGGEGNDIILGGGGNDIVEGGGGADSIVGGAGSDYASYVHSPVGVNINLLDNLASKGDAEGDVITEVENIEGSPFSDELRGDNSSNYLFGDGGDDKLVGFGGSDYLFGSLGNDIILGGDGDDFLGGGAGGDTLNGGEGSDFAVYTSSPEGVIIDLFANILTGGDAEFDTIFSIENLTGSSFEDVLKGDEKDNWLQGGGGDDFFEGRLGGDFLEGGTGSDTATYINSITGVGVDLDNNIGVGGEADFDTFSSIENLIGSNFSDTLIGNSSNNVITGNNGHDLLIGLGGSDILDAGNGDDILIGGSGADRLLGRGGYDIALYFDSPQGVDININPLFQHAHGGDAEGDLLSEIDSLGGSFFDDELRGNDSDNDLFGEKGDDILFGYGGIDIIIAGEGDDYLSGGSSLDLLDGGDGIDTAVYTGSSAKVSIDLLNGTASGGDAEGDLLLSIENLDGSAYNDTLVGNDFGNHFSGGGGADFLSGGLGIDTSSYSVSLLGVKVDLQKKTASGGDATGDTLISIENLEGSSFNDDLRGDDNSNLIEGLDGDDFLAGRNGKDIIHGGNGVDQLYGGEGNDQLFGGEGNDRLIGNEGNDVLSGNGGHDNLFGRDGNDRLYGGDGNDRILGDAGDDYLVGNAGNDLLIGGLGDDNLQGREGDDRIFGGDGNDELRGFEGKDYLVGNDGDDLIAGFDGHDSLHGRNGADRMYGNNGNDYMKGGAGKDFMVGNAGNDALYGEADNDKLYGRGGNDRLYGGGGNDYMKGGDGDDILDGGDKFDSLFGELGNDTFVFSNNWRHDKVMDWEEGETLDMSSLGLRSAGETDADVFAKLTVEEVDANTVVSITGDDHNSIVLIGIDSSTIDVDDFLF